MKLVFILMFEICLAHFSNPPGHSFNSPDVDYAGSVPFNRTVRKLLQIPAADSFDYMKWKLKISDIAGNAGDFELDISYGYYLPGTAYFQNGGKALHFFGKWNPSTVSIDNQRYHSFHLISKANAPRIYLLEMDSNILHLIDQDGKLFIGDGSFGFILNRNPPLRSK